MLNRDADLRNQPKTPSPTTETTPTAEPSSSETAVTQTAPADVGYFYNDLLPYGTWVDLTGVGWCWQPRAAVVNRSWRPYCDSGHWVYTDAGWFWQSDYSWGWAPFHYGRWAMHDRAGWVWVPDRVWGPAWVVWRSAEDRCGWAPLPPHAVLDARAGWRFKGMNVAASFDFGLRPEHFTFVATRDFADRDLRQRRLPTGDVRNFYAQTTVINNYTIKNRTVVNHGPPVQRMAAATPVPIPRATIHDAPPGSHAGPAPQGRSPTQPVVYRPELKAPAKPPTIVAQRVDDQHPVIQHPTITPGPVQHGNPSPITSRPQSQGPTRPQVLSPRNSQGTGGQQQYPGPTQNPSNSRGAQTGPASQGKQPGASGPTYGPSTGSGGRQPSSGGSGPGSGPSSSPGRVTEPSRPAQPSRPADSGGASSRSGPSGPASQGGPQRPNGQPQ
jgi:hypothetical protein